MIKEINTMLKFKKLNSTFDLGLEILELKIKKSELYLGGAYHIITKAQPNGGFEILYSFENLDQLLLFLERQIAKFRKSILEEYYW
jgi:hypothetical protein